jgi:hypothetical protein
LTELAVVLEEGFDDDPVTVRIGGTVRFVDESVTTRPQVGYARRFTLDLDDGEVEVTVDVGSGNGTATFTVPVGEVTNVGISLEDGSITHRTASEPFPFA